MGEVYVNFLVAIRTTVNNNFTKRSFCKINNKYGNISCKNFIQFHFYQFFFNLFSYFFLFFFRQFALGVFSKKKNIPKQTNIHAWELNCVPPIRYILDADLLYIIRMKVSSRVLLCLQPLYKRERARERSMHVLQNVHYML